MRRVVCGEAEVTHRHLRQALPLCKAGAEVRIGPTEEGLGVRAEDEESAIRVKRIEN